MRGGLCKLYSPIGNRIIRRDGKRETEQQCYVRKYKECHARMPWVPYGDVLRENDRGLSEGRILGIKKGWQLPPTKKQLKHLKSIADGEPNTWLSRGIAKKCLPIFSLPETQDHQNQLRTEYDKPLEDEDAEFMRDSGRQWHQKKLEKQRRKEAQKEKEVFQKAFKEGATPLPPGTGHISRKITSYLGGKRRRKNVRKRTRRRNK